MTTKTTTTPTIMQIMTAAPTMPPTSGMIDAEEASVFWNQNWKDEYIKVRLQLILYFDFD